MVEPIRAGSTPEASLRDIVGDRWLLDRFAVDARTLARGLIGQVLVRDLGGGTLLAGQIVETEAYVGVKDRASHAFARRRTARNEMMYARAGTLYVYFTYGMHHCMNVVCGEVDEPVAVLIRAVRPMLGLPEMSRRRFGDSAAACERAGNLCSGPGKLCQAMGVNLGHNGLDLVRAEELWIAEPGPGVRPIPRRVVQRTPRIGIGNAGSWVHAPLRWVVVGWNG